MTLCPECNGTRVDRSEIGNLFYAYCGELLPCASCGGTGLYKPALWERFIKSDTRKEIET